MIKIIIIFCVLLNISRSQEFEVFGFDCSNASFIQNLTLNDNVQNEENITKEEGVMVQIIQEMNEERVKVHEIKVKRSLFVQQCGDRNTPWSWWHEFLTHVESEVPRKLNEDEAQNLVRRGHIIVGKEFGIHKIFSITPGDQHLKLTAVGQIYYDIENENRFHCKGSDWSDDRGVVHPNVIATAIYHVQYHITTALTKNTQVLLSSDDGNCHLPGGSRSTLCYNRLLGINYWINRYEKNDKECKFLPTRKGFLNGEIISSLNTKIFVAEKENIFLKLTKTSDICNCKYTYSTQYKGLRVRQAVKKLNMVI